MNTQSLRIAMIAPPWLAMPIRGYGGIELVLQTLVHALQGMGVESVVFGNSERRLHDVSTRSIYSEEQYPNIHRPIYESLPILAAHMQFALQEIRADGNFDIIHDHNGFYGPQLLAWATRMRDIPPVIHTHHGPPFSSDDTIKQGIPDNRPFWDMFARQMGRVYIVGISDALVAAAPAALRSHILPTVYNAVDLTSFPFVSSKRDYFMTMARFSRDKGQHIAVRICAKKGYRLRMAGTVAGIASNTKLLFEFANPLSPYRGMADFRYFSDTILPYTLRYRKITFSGNLSGPRKKKFMAEARALLFPIDWEEPFGMAVIEALACGTPVVAMRRGAMPEIIQHGVTGFLADNEDEFAAYMDRVDEIDPAACRAAVADRFSAETMASAYIDRYLSVLKLA